MRLTDQAANYEDVAGLQTIGQSLEGTDMIVIQICRGGNCDNGKPDMYIEGGIHARQEPLHSRDYFPPRGKTPKSEIKWGLI